MTAPNFRQIKYGGGVFALSFPFQMKWDSV